MTGRIILAAIAGAHGIKGEVRLKLFGDGLESLSRFSQFEAARDGVPAQMLTLLSLRPDKIGGVGRFAEIADRTQAEAMRGLTLSVAREALPPLAEGEYYHADLIGLAVVSTDGAAVGTVIAVENFGAGDIIEIVKADGKTFMAPFNPQAVPEVGAAIILDSRFVA